jgi:hypothetical protein
MDGARDDDRAHPPEGITRYHRGVTRPSDPPPPPRTGDVDLGPTPASSRRSSSSCARPKEVLPRGRGAHPEASGCPKGARAAKWIVRVAVVLVVLAAAAGAVLDVGAALVRPARVRRGGRGARHRADHRRRRARQAGFRLLGVHATAAALPGARAQAPEIDVQTTGLHPDRMTVRRAELTLTGSWRTIDAAFSAWRASPQGGQGGAWAPTTLVVDESRVVWQAPFAENARVEASNTHLDVTWGGPSATVHARSDNVIVVVPGGKVGPWRVDLDRAPGTSRLRVALDPGVPDACTVLVVGNDEGTTNVDVKIPRSPLARLGVPPELLGLHGKALQADAAAHFAMAGAHGAEATSKGGLYGIEAGLPMALDVAWDASASGDPKAGLDVKKARLAVGPLVGAMTGTLKTFDDGFRLNLAWSATPVPCAAFEAPAARAIRWTWPTSCGGWRRTSGLARVAGEVTARGS